MKKLLAAVALVALVAVANGAEDPKPPQDKKEPAPNEKPAPRLKVGDRAPPLKASIWLQGVEVRSFEPGKAYVVEFWATWCGPCIAFMPDLAELQARYKDKGLTCIGFTNQDPKNTAEKAAAFVKKRGPKLRYTFAYAEDNTTWDTWMTAAGRTAIPCSFVVDKSGRIAYIGDPTYLGVVLPMVVDRNMNASAIRGEMEKIVQEWSAVSEALNAGLESGQPRAGLKALKEFETKYPPMANNVIIVRVKLSLLPKVGEVDETKKVAEAVMAKAIEQDNPSSLAQVAALLRRGPGKESKELLSVAVKAAEEAVRIAGDKDAHALIDLAETYFVAGNKAKAKDYARMAVTVSAGESDETRQYIEKEARKLQE